MKLGIAAFVVFLSCINPLSADWVTITAFEATSATQHSTNLITTKIKGKKMRIDHGPYASSIFDSETGEEILLFHPAKQFTINSASRRKETAELLKQLPSRLEELNTTNLYRFVPTSRHETFNGHVTEGFDWNSKTARYKFWISRDFTNYAAYLSAHQSIMAKMFEFLPESQPDERELPGLPIVIETQISIGGRPTGSTTSIAVNALLSISEESLDDSLFMIPPGYLNPETSRPSKPTAEGLREALELMKKKGISDAERKRYEELLERLEKGNPTHQVKPDSSSQGGLSRCQGDETIYSLSDPPNVSLGTMRS